MHRRSPSFLIGHMDDCPAVRTSPLQQLYVNIMAPKPRRKCRRQACLDYGQSIPKKMISVRYLGRVAKILRYQKLSCRQLRAGLWQGFCTSRLGVQTTSATWRTQWWTKIKTGSQIFVSVVSSNTERVLHVMRLTRKKHVKSHRIRLAGGPQTCNASRKDFHFATSSTAD